MNRKSTYSIPAAICGGLVFLGAIRGFADADDHSTPGDRDLTEVAVQTGKITTATLHGYVQGFGTVETAPATVDSPAAGAQLAPPSAGVVTKVDVLEGQHVEPGDVLVELKSQAAAAELERQRKLYAQQNTSLKNLQEAEAQLAMVQITAPLSGTVVRLNVRPGQGVDLTTIVAEVMDLNRLALRAEIPSAEANDLKPGSRVEVLTAPPVTTKLLLVSPNVDQANDTVLVRALLPKDCRLRPGQLVSLRIVTAVHMDRLVVPVESVVTDENGKSVIALVKDGEATQMPVQTGLRDKGLVEIAAPGIRDGDVVVTTGAYGLPEKTKIRVQNPSGDGTATHSPAAR